MKLFLLAGEASGDRLGADLMRGLRHLTPDVTFRGIAGPEMQSEGLDGEWMNGRMDEWTYGRMDEWTNGRMDEWTNG